MKHSLEELEAQQLKGIKSHLEHELETAYSAKTIKKGFRLSPLQLNQINFEVDELTASVKDKKHTYQIRMVMPFFEDSGYSYTSCSCQEMSIDLEESRCHHMWLAQHQFLQSVNAHLAEQEVFSSTWEQMVSILDPLMTKLDEAKHKPKRYRVSWELDSNLNCYPFLASVNESGSLSYLKKLSFSDFLKNERYWQDSANKGIAARVGHYLVQYKGNDYAALTYEILSELAESKLSLIDHKQASVRVHKEALSVSFKIEKEGLSWYFPGFDSEHDVVKVFERGVLVYNSGKCALNLLEMPSNSLFDFCNFLALTGKKTIEPKNVGPVLSRLSKLQLHLPINFKSAYFPVSTMEASKYTYLRLTPLPASGVILECFKCPLGSYTKTQHYLSPGLGPDVLWNLDDFKSIKCVTRNLELEILEAKSLMNALKLGSLSPLNPYCYEIKDDLLAIELVDKLNQLKEKEKIIVEWPANIEKKNFEIIEPEEETPIKIEVNEKNDWFFLKGGLTVNGEYVNLSSLIQAMTAKQNYLKLQHGKWLKITKCLKERLQTLDSFYEGSCYDRLPVLRPSPSTTSLWQELKNHDFLSISSPPKWESQITAIAKKSKTSPEVPKDFTGSLRSYQKAGFTWLMKLSAWGVGGILADDMGLGKTVQTICFLLKRATEGPSLIVCPSSVTENWKKEVNRFAPNLKMFDLRSEKGLPQNILKPNDLLVCSYGLLLSHAEKLATCHWNAIVFDEAQVCKNPLSKTFKSAKSLKSGISIALSGTPIENNLQDLWAIFSLVNPALLGPWQQFKEEWIKESGNRQDENHRLSQIIAPFLLRRLKQDYLSELPPKTEKILQLHLSKEERTLYDQIRAEAVALLTASKDEQNEPSGDQSFNKARIKILSYLTKLRQLCSHPVLVEADWPVQSSKMDLFKEKAYHLLKSGHKVLVFSQFPSFLKLLQSSMLDYGARCLYLDGTTPSAERSKSIDQFQNDEADFFFISLKAGGTGINLTKADYVFHMDPWWNPAVQAQATDRAYRMGQKNPVTIYKFICKYTVEETMTGLHKRKTDLASEILSDQDQDIKRFDADYIGKLLSTEAMNPTNHSYSGSPS